MSADPDYERNLADAMLTRAELEARRVALTHEAAELEPQIEALQEQAREVSREWDQLQRQIWTLQYRAREVETELQGLGEPVYEAERVIDDIKEIRRVLDPILDDTTVPQIPHEAFAFSFSGDARARGPAPAPPALVFGEGMAPTIRDILSSSGPAYVAAMHYLAAHVAEVRIPKNAFFNDEYEVIGALKLALLAAGLVSTDTTALVDGLLTNIRQQGIIKLSPGRRLPRETQITLEAVNRWVAHKRGEQRLAWQTAVRRAITNRG